MKRSRKNRWRSSHFLEYCVSVPDDGGSGFDSRMSVRQERKSTGALGRIQAVASEFERKYLDPAFDGAVGWLFGTGGQPLVRALRQPELTPQERAINRGFFLSTATLGLGLASSLGATPLGLLGYVGLLYNSVPIYASVYRDLVEERKLGVDLLSALVNTAYLAGGMVVLGSVAQLSFYFSVRMLQLLKDHISGDLTEVLTAQGQTVWLSREGEPVAVRVETLAAGDVVVVQAGEMVLVDGVVLQGAGVVDLQSLTGRSNPVEAGEGDLLLAFTRVLSGELWIRVDQGGEHATTLVGQWLAWSVDTPTAAQLKFVRVTDQLVVPVILLSALALPWLGPFRAAALLGIHPQRHLLNFGALHNLSALLYASRQQILVKDGRSLELLRRIDTVVFDKTGTLTEWEPQVGAIHIYGSWSADQLLAWAAAAEQRQQHPFARALLAGAQARGVALPVVDSSVSQAGFGLTAEIEGRSVLVGSWRWIVQNGGAMPPGVQGVWQGSCASDASWVWVAVDGQVQGAVEVQLSVRPEAAAVVAALCKLPRIQKLLILSGDEAAPTAAVAEQLGIDEAVAELSPSDKAARIAALQAEGRTVCFVGDGLNDLVAFKQADLSIALQGSAATETAQIVLLDPDLCYLPKLFALGQEYAADHRALFAAVLTPGVLCALGVFWLGFGLPQMTLFDAVDVGLGTSIAVRPWQRQRRLLALQGEGEVLAADGVVQSAASVKAV
ncbi:MAG: HAD-IC family P-type ATPase [Chloroflexi bacterium]|nr:HAD-IC family P-type ATPase [Chloroflexota bacterium]